MPNVRTVTDSGDTAALLILDDGSKAIWTPDRELARSLLGKPIPDDWTIKPNKQGTGNVALPPRKGGGGQAAWRNTKEGFDAEQAGRRRWQEIEEDHKDRRTAVMTAFEHGPDAPPAIILEVAGQIYAWLVDSPAPGPSAETPDGVGTTEANARPPQAGDHSAVVGGEAATAPEPEGDSAIGTPSGSTILEEYPEDWPTERAK